MLSLQDRAFDPKLLQKLVGEDEQFDVGLGFDGADDLRVELMELAEAALLRPFVAEGGTVSGNLHRRNCCHPSLR